MPLILSPQSYLRVGQDGEDLVPQVQQLLFAIPLAAIEEAAGKGEWGNVGGYAALTSKWAL